MPFSLPTKAPAGLSAPVPLLPGQSALPAVASKAAGLTGFLGAAGGLLGGIGGVIAPVLSSVLGGPDAPSTSISGAGPFYGGGINVGSKVVGSGSAATSFPSAPGSGGLMTDNSATAGSPKWLVPALLGGGLLVAVLLFFPKRKK